MKDGFYDLNFEVEVPEEDVVMGDARDDHGDD